MTKLIPCIPYIFYTSAILQQARSKLVDLLTFWFKSLLLERYQEPFSFGTGFCAQIHVILGSSASEVWEQFRFRRHLWNPVKTKVAYLQVWSRTHELLYHIFLTIYQQYTVNLVRCMPKIADLQAHNASQWACRSAMFWAWHPHATCLYSTLVPL